MAALNTPRRVEHQQTDKGYVPVYTTAVVDQPWETYTRADHETWATLFRRQREILVDRACREFIDNQQRFGMTPDAIPRFDDLNAVLAKATGWKLVGVEGLLPELTFFDHLANRRFPVTWWIRKPEQIDYIAEPDLFHDLFGHVPLLLNPVFGDYMQAYGRGGVRAHGIGGDAEIRDARKEFRRGAPLQQRFLAAKQRAPDIVLVDGVARPVLADGEIRAGRGRPMLGWGLGARICRLSHDATSQRNRLAQPRGWAGSCGFKAFGFPTATSRRRGQVGAASSRNPPSVHA